MFKSNLLTIKYLVMKKSLKDFKSRELKNLDKIKGGGNDNVIDRDKVRRPKPGV